VRGDGGIAFGRVEGEGDVGWAEALVVDWSKKKGKANREEAEVSDIVRLEGEEARKQPRQSSPAFQTAPCLSNTLIIARSSLSAA
jgi:hypothetical protein